MTKLLIGVLSLALVGVGGLVAAVDGFGEDRPVRSVSIPAGTTDVPGPCDESEHANDPRCTSVATSTNRADDDQPGRTVTTGGAADVSGPCDEPEHANDPRCTGIGASTTDDRSGRGNGEHNDDRRSGPGAGGDHERADDRSGSNSGKS